MHWYELPNNIRRKIKDGTLKPEDKTVAEKLLEALPIADPDRATLGFKGLRMYAKFGRKAHNQCEMCHQLQLIGTRDSHDTTRCHVRKMATTEVIAVGDRYVCVLCLQTFGNLEQLRFHMRDKWSSKQLGILGYPVMIYNTYTRRTANAAIENSHTLEVKAL